MSTAEGLAPSIVLGQSLILPQYGRVDLSYTQNIVQTSFAAGATFRYVVPGAQVEIPQLLHVFFQTSATVANRGVAINMQDALGVSYARSPVNALQAASNLVAYSFNPYAQSFSQNNRAVAPMPLLVLQPGDQVVFSVTNLQATDQITELSYTSQVIPTGPPLVRAAEEPAVTPVLT